MSNTMSDAEPASNFNATDSFADRMDLLRGLNKEIRVRYDPKFLHHTKEMEELKRLIEEYDQTIESVVVNTNGVTEKQNSLEKEVRANHSSVHEFANEVEKRIDEAKRIAEAALTAASAASAAVSQIPVTPLAKDGLRVAPARRRPRDDDSGESDSDSDYEKADGTFCERDEKRKKQKKRSQVLVLARLSAMEKRNAVLEKKAVASDLKISKLEKAVEKLTAIVTSNQAMSTGAVFSTAQSADSVLPLPTPVPLTTTIPFSRKHQCLYCPKQYAHAGFLARHMTQSHSSAPLTEFGLEPVVATTSVAVAPSEEIPSTLLSCPLSPLSLFPPLSPVSFPMSPIVLLD